MKPKIFIGSSSEQKEVANAIQAALDDYRQYHSTTWSNGVFGLSEYPLESLIKRLDESDYAIFVLGADDTAKMREEKHNIVRDNVIFELGLFIGRLGREKVFYIVPDKTELHLPSDLSGITKGTYDTTHANIQAAVNTFVTNIRKQINDTFLPFFPERGVYGINILATNMDLELNQWYSMSALTPLRLELKLEIETLDAIDENCHWIFDMSPLNWIRKNYDQQKHKQIFMQKSGVESDMNILFQGVKKVQLNFFMNSEEKPYMKKEINFK